MPSMANGDVESSAESPDAEEHQDFPKSSPAAAATKGRGLRRWRRIRREQQRDGYAAAAAAAAAGGGGAGGGGGDEDSSQLHKRRIPLPAGAPKVKHEAAPVEAESSTASVESRFIPPAPESAKLDPGLGFLVASAGFSLGAGGADSDNSEDRSSSRSSTAARAPRVFPRHGHGASLHSKNHRAGRSRADRLRVHAEAENSRSSVESDVHSSNALKARHLGVGVTGNGVHKGLSGSCDHSDEGHPSEEVQSTAAGGYCKENGSSVVGRLVRGSDDSGDDVEDALDEGSELKEQNGGLHSGADPYAQSILLLQRTQEALENEIEKFVAVGKKPGDDFDIYDDEWSGSVHLEETIEEASENIKRQEFRSEEASVQIKDSKALQLRVLDRMQLGKAAAESTSLLSSEFELDGLYQEKIEAEIQCIILTAANQTWATLACDQMVLYEAQKSLTEDYKQLGLKLQHTENRATMLEEMAEKLQVQCKELSSSSEVLQLQSKASRVSLFCFIQFILLCIAIGTYLMRLVPSSPEIVPT